MPLFFLNVMELFRRSSSVLLAPPKKKCYSRQTARTVPFNKIPGWGESRLKVSLPIGSNKRYSVASPTTDPKNNSTEQSYHYPRPESIKSWRADVSEALYDAGMDKVADRWLTCSDKPVTRLRPKPGTALPAGAEMIYVCTGDHTHEAEIYSQTCDLRICPECARRHSARLVARYLPKMTELMHQHHNTYRFRLVTFTLPFALTDEDIQVKYKQGFNWVFKVIAGLMSAVCPDWKEKQAFLTSAEFGENGYKLHYHVIHYGQYLNQVDLSRAWSTASCGAGYIVDVRAFPFKGKDPEQSLREVLKYATKFSSQDKITGEITCIPAELVPVLARVLEKTRRVRAYGLFFNLPEPDRPDHSCDTCGGNMLGIPVSYWDTYVTTGFLPREWSREESLLHLKPADKSSFSSGNLSPPGDPPERLQQKQLAILKDMRIQSHD